MSSLFERITRRKPTEGLPTAGDGHDDVAARPASAEASAQAPERQADPAAGSTPADDTQVVAGSNRAERTEVQPESPHTAAVVSDIAAADARGSVPLLPGEDPADTRPTALRRGRLRKRMRFLEREHDLMLRDLGGLVYEIHRSARDGNEEHHRQLVVAKLERLSRVDYELRAAASVLGRSDTDLVLREPGIGGLCPRCGEIFGSDARFCSACAFPVSEGAVEVKGQANGAQAAVAAAGAPGTHSGASATTGGLTTTESSTSATGDVASRGDHFNGAPPGNTGREEATEAQISARNTPPDRDMTTQNDGTAPLDRPERSSS
ncbi:MAG: zinc ribbon domain-containing protein [Actinomycetota bacterium]|nr:zinc ribbon domain-containing protein [Actinomycetota bacterium]